MIIRKLSKSTPTALWLGWDPVPGCEGYLFYVGGVRVSRTFDPLKREIKFSADAEQKGVRIDAIVFTPIDTGTWPSAPPPVYKKVAPRVAYKEGGSDARYCFFNPDGSLRPGVSREADGDYRDEVAEYNTDGLCKGSERSGGGPENCPTGAKQIDGRPYCSLPMTGDPTKNTGAWLV